MSFPAFCKKNEFGPVYIVFDGSKIGCQFGTGPKKYFHC